MATKKDTSSPTKLAARQVTIELDAQGKKLAADAKMPLTAETYLQVMRQRDHAARS